MFTFKHPKPFIQRPVAMQVVARKAQVLPDVRLIVVDTPAGTADGPAQNPSDILPGEQTE